MRMTTLFISTSLCGLVLAGVVGRVHAQTASSDSKSTETTPASTDSTTNPKGDAPTTVIVKGAKPQNRIDRQVYDNTKDIDSQTGTATDALNKVPSVNVDPNGNVTLRGNSNVQVYVDGKPSAMMQGDNRAGALQSMSSGDIGSIEVMTNPGAAYSSEGSGGIINLVMRRNRKPGKSGALTVNVGEVSHNAALNGAYNNGKFTLSGGLSVRHDVRPSRSGSVLQPLDGDGVPLSTLDQSGTSQMTFDNMAANAGLDYNLGDMDSLGVQVSYSHRDIDSRSDDTYAGYDAAEVYTNGYTRASTMTGPHEDSSLDLHWDHTGQTPGESLKVSLRLGRSDGPTVIDNLSEYTLPAGVALRDTKRISSDFHNGVFSVDYARPIGTSQFTTGLQITQDDNAYSNVATGPDVVGAPVTINPYLTNRFEYEQTLGAIYSTWQMALGDKWIAQAGLRAEALDLITNSPDTGTWSHIKYTKVSPSVFATYTLSQTAKLRFSYSHRLQRPGAQDLNPSITYVDAQNLSSGNPNLKPAETDSFEAGYEYAAGMTSYQIRTYYRKTENSLTSYSYFLPTGQLLTTKQNFGNGESGGLEVNANGKLGKKLMVSANANLSENSLVTPSVTGTQRATTLSGRIMLDYTMTAKDRMQFMYFSSGKMLTGQGYRSPFMMGNLSYRHQYTPKAALVLTVADPFRTMKFRTVTDSDTVYSEQVRSLSGQTVMLGLSYTLGGSSTAPMDMFGGPPRNGPPIR